MKTIKRTEVTKLRMIAGNENKITNVIHDDMLVEWVAIGWIDIRKATEKDKRKYPTVVD